MKKLFFFLVLVALGMDAARTEVSNMSLAHARGTTLAMNEEGTAPVDAVDPKSSPSPNRFDQPVGGLPEDSTTGSKNTDSNDNLHNNSDQKPSPEP